MRESEYFINIIEEFAKKKSIRDKLDYFYDNGISAWEKWFQLELRYFLEQKKNEIYIEDLFNRDKRTAKKYLNRVDLTYRRPNTSSEHYVGLELKVVDHPTVSIKKAIDEDLKGMAEILPSEWPFKAVISTAVYKNEGEAIKSKYIDLVDKIGVHLSFGQYYIAIMFWESDILANANRENYKRWLSDNITV